MYTYLHVVQAMRHEIYCDIMYIAPIDHRVYSLLMICSLRYLFIHYRFLKPIHIYGKCLCMTSYENLSSCIENREYKLHTGELQYWLLVPFAQVLIDCQKLVTWQWHRPMHIMIQSTCTSTVLLVRRWLRRYRYRTTTTLRHSYTNDDGGALHYHLIRLHVLTWSKLHYHLIGIHVLIWSKLHYHIIGVHVLIPYTSPPSGSEYKYPRTQV